ncbi:hypothetical protein Tco_0689030, partial [Tanacetum coccineum]
KDGNSWNSGLAHPSQFVDTEAEGYVPEYADTKKRLQAAS